MEQAAAPVFATDGNAPLNARATGSRPARPVKYSHDSNLHNKDTLMITFEDIASRTKPIAVVGLGYVGLPLAVAFSRHFDVIGFDISHERIAALEAGHDATDEVSDDDLQSAPVSYTANPEELKKAGIIIVAVPTPIDANRKPDLTPVVGSTTTVGKYLSEGALVVYESTVYPGLTEEICIPILEKESGLTCGRDFKVGYSPERINPGDKVHTLQTIVKVVSGQDDESADTLGKMYEAVVTAGVHRVSTIKVAEAAKVIENTQRDLNIALMNELAQIFDHMGIDTLEVLEAAGTKWNFLPFRPGLVGGHCIGVDPYYLTFKAESMGMHPQVILAGRRINDTMGKYIVERTIKEMIRNNCRIKGSRIGVLGLTFKENVPDLRNSKVKDILTELAEYSVEILVHDPKADPAEARALYGVDLVGLEAFTDLDALILAVSHDVFKTLDPATISSMFPTASQALVMDIKGFFDPAACREAGIRYWRL